MLNTYSIYFKETASSKEADFEHSSATQQRDTHPQKHFD
jgi:hypothetical protein